MWQMPVFTHASIVCETLLVSVGEFSEKYMTTSQVDKLSHYMHAHYCTMSVFSVRLRSSYARYCDRLSVCLSVRLSNACIVTKLKDLAKKVQL